MTEWIAQERFPDLSGSKLISFDVETKDPDLKERGPSTFRGGGYVCGFSVATNDGFCGYYPIKHLGGGNLPDPEKAVRWLKAQLETSVPKLGANLLYDAEWCRADLKINVKGKLIDVQVADPLIDENYHSYSLDNIARRWLGESKFEEELYTAGVQFLHLCGKGKTEEEQRKDVIGQVKGRIWELPASMVGRYGEADALLSFKIWEKQKAKLFELGLEPVFDLECRVLEVLLAMRFKGIPVDVPRAERTRDELLAEYKGLYARLTEIADREIDIWSGDDVAVAAEALGLVFPVTDKENPSFQGPWLEVQEAPFFKLLLECRQVDRCGGTFIQSNIIDKQVNGVLHPRFWQVKNDRGGTASGRFASSDPNAQNFPSRNERLATKVRSLLKANDGCRWGNLDYNSQEPRVTVHYALCLGLSRAEEAREALKDPKFKEHALVAEWTGLPYKVAKIVNLGKSYGMGPKKFSSKYGKTLKEAYAIFNTYDEAFPYKKELSNFCERVVKSRGFIKTLLGRHCNFNLFGSPNYSKGVVPKRYEEALKEFGTPLIRYFIYKAMNRLIQGSSADMIKKAMVDCFDAGFVPNVTVHDELDFADIDSDFKLTHIKEIMENCVSLKLPLVAEVEAGPNWGETEAVK